MTVQSLLEEPGRVDEPRAALLLAAAELEQVEERLRQPELVRPRRVRRE